MSEAVIYQPSAKDIRMVIAASSAGTIFEWYDFFIYGTLAAIIGKAFFPSDNATLEILLVWAGFAEIGRASCREGVCQYVQISVVAVSLKKKDRQTMHLTGYLVSESRYV